VAPLLFSHFAPHIGCIQKPSIRVACREPGQRQAVSDDMGLTEALVSLQGSGHVADILTRLAQTKQTPQQLWEKLPAVREAEQKVRSATQALDAARRCAIDMARECAEYAKLRPARAALGYGMPHKPAELRQADLAVGRAEQVKSGAEGYLRSLASDLQAQSQQARQRDAQSASQLQTQKHVEELEAALRDRAKRYERDITAARAQQTHTRGYERCAELCR
jgi:hypothetical protein